jgi:anti-sigma regulatory factor (Ser/Thr protein kinase)
VSRGSGRRTGGQAGHAVQFYLADGELAGSVSRYLAEGIRSGDGVVAVATRPHMDEFLAGLSQTGIDAATAQRDGRLLLLDASTLLGTFFDGDSIDRGPFQAAASGLIGRASLAGPAAGAGRRVRIYAEMVALLWDAGKVSLAIELEELWNDLAARLPFSLLCGYPASVLDEQGHEDAALDVRRLHSAAADTRSFPADLDSVRAARHYATGLLEPADQPLAGDLAIAVTELAANAVLHARSAFTVTVSRWATGIRVAVRDNAAVAATGEPVPFPVTTGHGLSVVAALASRWGVERTPAGKVVWAELGAC